MEQYGPDAIGCLLFGCPLCIFAAFTHWLMGASTYVSLTFLAGPIAAHLVTQMRK
jgi:hypothetical protein